MDDFLDDLRRAEERRRTETINGVEYTAQCTDPYGMWHLSGKNVPESLKGEYTSIEVLWKAVNAYEAAEKLKNPARGAPSQSTVGELKPARPNVNRHKL